jgi:hypothetical protein
MTPLEPLQTDDAASDMVVNGHIVERDRTHLNEREHALLKELLRPGASIEAVIPADAPPSDLWKTLDACVRGLGLLEARICRLKPIIGRILVMFENKPSLYKDLGYETYSDFMKQGVYEKLGLHRTSAYEGKMVAQSWPQITPDRYAGKLGPKKMGIIAKTGITGRSSNAEMILQTAESMSVRQFQAYVEQRGMLAHGEANGATFTIQTNLNRYALFKAFFADGRIQSVAGSKDADIIMECVIQEIYNEWIGRYDEERASKNGKTPQPVA